MTKKTHWLIPLRQNPLTRRKFPTNLWKSIIELTETYPLNEVCRELNLQPNYLKEKINEIRSPILDFQEVHF